MLTTFEISFADALLDADQPVPAGIIAHNTAVPSRRFAVYRNNVVTGLVKALRSRFPVTETIVGEEFFAAMARIFVTAQPPRSPLLATYGDAFPAFIVTFEPARDLPYLADVARLEAARTRAYHAADAPPVVDVEPASPMGPGRLLPPHATLFHAATRIEQTPTATPTLRRMLAIEHRYAAAQSGGC